MVRMLFLIDGYNVTKGDPATRGDSLEAQRDALVRRVRARGANLLGAGRIVVVFDGDAAVSGADPRPEQAGGSSSHPVEVVYSRGLSADDDIVSRAARHSGPVWVVTSDLGLAERVRAQVGASVEIRGREILYEGTRSRRGMRDGGRIARDEGIPPGANKINEELKRVWLEGGE